MPHAWPTSLTYRVCVRVCDMSMSMAHCYNRPLCNRFAQWIIYCASPIINYPPPHSAQHKNNNNNGNGHCGVGTGASHAGPANVNIKCFDTVQAIGIWWCWWCTYPSVRRPFGRSCIEHDREPFKWIIPATHSYAHLLWPCCWSLPLSLSLPLSFVCVNLCLCLFKNYPLDAMTDGQSRARSFGGGDSIRFLHSSSPNNTWLGYEAAGRAVCGRRRRRR